MLIGFPPLPVFFIFLFRLLLDNPDAEFSFDAPRGYQESTILGAVVTKENLEPKASKCTKVNYFHLVTGFAFKICLTYLVFSRDSRCTFGILVPKTRN